jgi:glycerol kinase
MSGVVLAIDQGTSSTKALVVDADGEILSEAHRAVPVTMPQPGAVEVDPATLLASVVESGRQAVREAGGRAGPVRIDAVALANQGETVLRWDPGSGLPESAAIVWQDRRADVVCRQVRDHGPRLADITGLPLDPYFSAPKMRWLRDCVGPGGVITTTDTWLLHALTGEFVTDVTTASRSLLLDVATGTWSDEAWELFGLREARPRLARNDEVVGTTTTFGPPVPVAGIVVDQQAALWAQRCREPGQSKCTYGTGAFLLANAGAEPVRSARGLTTSIAWSLGEERRWCLDGQVYTVGQALSWLADVGILGGPEDLDAVGSTVADTAGVAFVPALAGLAAPHWQPSATGGFLGLNLSATRAHLVRAVCTGIAAQVVELVEAVVADLGDAGPGGVGQRDAGPGGVRERVLRVDGGLTRSHLLMQVQADLLQAPVEVSRTPHATALGAADLALRATSGRSLPEVAGQVVEPARSATWAAEQLGSWRNALALTRQWASA